MNNRPILRMTAILLILGLVATACSAGSDSGSAVTAFDEAQDAERAVTTTMAAIGTAQEPAADSLGSGGLDAGSLTQVNLGREIIFTAEVVVAVTDVAAAGVEATNAVQSLGGFVFGQQSTGGSEARTTITFKVPPENFQAALAALGTIGEVRTQSITASDVTDRVVDLESRISTAEASVERLKGFLETAGDIDTIAELERQLLDRETTLEVLRGQLRTLEDAVGLATITITLTEALTNPQLQLFVSGYEGADDDGASCSANPEFSVLEGEIVTVCFEITNVGDTLLTGFTLRDTVLDLELDDLNVVWGDPARPLEPGQSMIFATTVSVERTLRPQTRVTAVPVNADGERVDAREVSQTVSARIGALDPGGIPGFADGLDRSWSFLRDLGGLAVLAAGLLLPFVWVPVVIYLVWRRQRTTRGTVVEQSGAD